MSICSSLPGTGGPPSPVHHFQSAADSLDVHACSYWFTPLHAALCWARPPRRRDWAPAVLNCWKLDSGMWQPGERTGGGAPTQAALIKDGAPRQRRCPRLQGARRWNRTLQHHAVPAPPLRSFPTCPFFFFFFKHSMALLIIPGISDWQAPYIRFLTVSLTNGNQQLNWLLLGCCEHIILNFPSGVMSCYWQCVKGGGVPAASDGQSNKQRRRGSRQVSSGATDNWGPLIKKLNSNLNDVTSLSPTMLFLFFNLSLLSKGQRSCAITF